MLRYYSTILSEDVWQNFLFILATPGAQGVAALSPDIPKHIRARCCDGCGDPRAIIYQDTAHAIHRMYRDGMLNLHLICDDFESALYPPQAPADLVRIIHDVTHINLMPYYYFILHARDAEKTSRQRQLMLRLYKDEQAGQYLYPYLMSTEQDDNSLANPESLWRALMCEILVISAGRRTHQRGTLSSLGYTSLNANEKELVNLRRQHLLELMQDYCSSPYTDTAAWQDLLQANAPMPDRQNVTEASEHLRHWLQGRIRQDMTLPSQYQINNFRAFTCALTKKEPDDLLSNAKRFFDMNLRSRTGAQDGKRPEYVSAEKYCQELLVRLSTRHNLCGFPLAVIDLVLHGLSALLAYRPTASVPSYPTESVFQKAIPQQHKKYMLQCCSIAEEAARRQIEEGLIPVYAKAYGEMFAYLRSLLANAASVHAEIARQMIPPAAYAHLQSKYPLYNADIVRTLNLCQETLFAGVRIYQPGTVTPDAARIKEALRSADAQLHSKMSHGFRSSFISAITHEFSTTGAMETFLGNYLNNKRRMFHNILEAAVSPIVTHFSNEQLASTNWADAHRNNTFFVRNDNVERLDYFSLQRSLADYVSEENRLDPNNEYFWQVRPDEDAIDLPDAPSMPRQTVILPDAKPHAAGSAPQTQTAPANQARMRLLEDQGQPLLTWEWDPAVPFYQVTINGKPYPIHQAKYGAGHGMPLDGLLRPGKNVIELSVLNGPKVAEEAFCGPKTPVDYRKTSGALYTAYVPSAQKYLIVRETFTAHNEHGTQIHSHIDYPIEMSEPARGKTYVSYEGLSFSGSWDLIADPADPFCRFAPRQNANLCGV